MVESIESMMTRNPVCLSADASLVDAAKAMDEHNIGDVLVLDNGTLCGIVTDRDIAIRAVARGNDPASVRLGEICSRDLVTLNAVAAIEDAMVRMREHAIRRMPVLDRGQPVGIVSLGDLAAERDRGSLLGKISTAPANH